MDQAKEVKTTKPSSNFSLRLVPAAKFERYEFPAQKYIHQFKFCHLKKISCKNNHAKFKVFAIIMKCSVPNLFDSFTTFCINNWTANRVASKFSSCRYFHLESLLSKPDDTTQARFLLKDVLANLWQSNDVLFVIKNLFATEHAKQQLHFEKCSICSKDFSI